MVTDPFRSKCRDRGRRGSTTVQFAVVLPLLVVMIFGVLDWGTILFTRQHAIQAAREGVRIRAAEGSASAGTLALTATQNYLADIYPSSSGDFTVTTSGIGSASAWVRVRFSHADVGITGFFLGTTDVGVEMDYLTAVP